MFYSKVADQSVSKNNLNEMSIIDGPETQKEDACWGDIFKSYNEKWHEPGTGESEILDQCREAKELQIDL